MWEAVGGAQQGGLLVRIGKATSSAQKPDRLSSGSFVKEIALEGERLNYELLSGSGPENGWVSIKMKGVELLRKSDKSETEVAALAPEEKELPAALAALPVLKPLAESLWIAKYKSSPHARCRLICVFGAGADSSSFSSWNNIIETSYPALDLVMVQLPQHGLNRKVPVQQGATACAKLIVDELLTLEGEDAGPFALFGFSIGATVVYAMQREFEARECSAVCMYAGGRASPSISYRPEDEDKQKTPATYLKWFAKAFLSPKDTEKLQKMIKACESDATMLESMSDVFKADLVMGNSCGRREIPKPIPVKCDIHVCASSGDKVWPACKSAQVSSACTPEYEDIEETWTRWTTGNVTSTVLENLPHYELCAAKLLRVVCNHLVALLSKPQC